MRSVIQIATLIRYSRAHRSAGHVKVNISSETNVWLVHHLRAIIKIGNIHM